MSALSAAASTSVAAPARALVATRARTARPLASPLRAQADPSAPKPSPIGTATSLPASYAGRVRSVTAKEAGDMMKSGEWTLLDVRPPHEQKKVAVDGAAAVPLFIEDPEASTVTGMLKAATAFGMGGWWLGGTHLVPNEQFLAQAAAALPADKEAARVVVACQKGLRSLAACEALIRAGYPQVAWISGGLDSGAPGDIPTVGGKDVRYAGIGGLSEVLGWTDVQREARRSKGMMQDLGGVFAVAGAFLVADLALFAYEQFAAMTGAPNPFDF
jgi:rhodanese-related sulfurtransferase